MADDRLSVTNTPEFKAAVQQAAAEAVTEALKLARSQAAEPAAAHAADMSWVQVLALEMATLTDQGTGQRLRVPPDVVKARAAARDRMHALINQAREEGLLPSYRLTNKTVLDDQLVDPFWIDASHTAQPTEIDWLGVPNDVMVPINDVAKAIYREFQDSIGTLPQEHQFPGAPLKVTRGGLVVKGGPTPGVRQTNAQRVDNINQGDGLRLHHREQPGRFKDVSILGTIAAPARQSI